MNDLHAAMACTAHGGALEFVRHEPDPEIPITPDAGRTARTPATPTGGPMPITFTETMQGSLLAEGSPPVEHPVAFTVTARHEGGGYFRLDGTATASPWVARAPCTGSLRFAPGSVRYRLRFGGPDGAIWQIAGEKLPRPSAPLRSMTTLPLTLVALAEGSDGPGERIAGGALRFSLADLPRFALSWLPRPRRRRSPGAS